MCIVSPCAYPGLSMVKTRECCVPLLWGQHHPTTYHPTQTLEGDVQIHAKKSFSHGLSEVDTELSCSLALFWRLTNSSVQKLMHVILLENPGGANQSVQAHVDDATSCLLSGRVFV
ncbi:MAG TPA: hypothetical protein DCE42_01975 [Myxococcales bacterium]|nr:hypothetical protein [Deltaproteobacteria bacterium]MBU51698.1 hypothetical protein [Deltaproteobacteria bacterium]HAA53491.1 hypothetical protein [Myxococcales bacterium]